MKKIGQLKHGSNLEFPESYKFYCHLPTLIRLQRDAAQHKLHIQKRIEIIRDVKKLKTKTG